LTLDKDRFIHQDPNYLFSIDQNSGVLSQIERMDREERSLWVFIVRASDKSSITTPGALHTDVLVEVRVLDENDSPPVFKQGNNIAFAIDENRPKGTVVGNVAAFDPDLSPSTVYTIESQLDDDLFYVDTSNGNLCIKQSIDADSLDLPVDLEFSLIATDGERSDLPSSRLQITVTLNDLNDNLPQLLLSNDEITSLVDLNQTTLNGIQQITKMKAFDPDRDSAMPQQQIDFVRCIKWSFLKELLSSSFKNQSHLNGISIVFIFF
jgi:hypothetical protein